MPLSLTIMYPPPRKGLKGQNMEPDLIVNPDVEPDFIVNPDDEIQLQQYGVQDQTGDTPVPHDETYIQIIQVQQNGTQDLQDSS